MDINAIVKPVPALLLNRTRGNVGWFKDFVLWPDVWPEVGWNEAVIVFWNEKQKTSGTVARCNYN